MDDKACILIKDDGLPRTQIEEKIKYLQYLFYSPYVQFWYHKEWTDDTRTHTQITFGVSLILGQAIFVPIALTEKQIDDIFVTIKKGLQHMGNKIEEVTQAHD